jgi:hypothetical protein
MTISYKQALIEFKDSLPDGEYKRMLKKDRPALRFEWQCYMNSLGGSQRITSKQYHSWSYPESWND